MLIANRLGFKKEMSFVFFSLKETQHVAKDPEALWSAAATLDRISRSTSKSFKVKASEKLIHLERHLALEYDTH